MSTALIYVHTNILYRDQVHTARLFTLVQSHTQRSINLLQQDEIAVVEHFFITIHQKIKYKKKRSGPARLSLHPGLYSLSRLVLLLMGMGWRYRVQLLGCFSRQKSRDDLGLDDHTLSTHGLLHMEAEDEPVEIPQPRVLSALNHCLARVCNLDGADAGLRARISEGGIKRHQLPIVLQQ